MWDFLQIYGIWIVFGVLFILMMRMHSGEMHGNGMGGGCGMGMGHDQSDEPSNTQRAVQHHDGIIEGQRVVPLGDVDSDTQNATFVHDVSTKEEEVPSSQYPDPVGQYSSKW